MFFFHQGLSNEEVKQEILKCIGITSPGPHAFLLVAAVGRFTEEERNTIRQLQELFGRDMMKYLIVVFTRKDELDREKKTIGDLLKGAPKSQRDFLKECNNRTIALNNNAAMGERCSSSRNLLEMINEMVKKNGGSYYDSTPMFEDVEDIFEERMLQIDHQYHRNMAEFMKNVSLEYQIRLQNLFGQEDALQMRLKSYNQCFEKFKESIADIQNDMVNLRNNIGSDADEENDAQLDRLRIGIERIEREIFTVQTNKVAELREEFREELENGNVNLLRRIWTRITRAGTGIKLRIKSMFDSLARRVHRT